MSVFNAVARNSGRLDKAGVDWLAMARAGSLKPFIDTFSLDAGSHCGWPTTRVEGDELGRRNSERFPARAALDLRAEYRRPLAIGSLAVTLEVSNAVNVGNSCCQRLIASDDGAGGTSFTTKESDWLPVVPSIGILWEF